VWVLRYARRAQQKGFWLHTRMDFKLIDLCPVVSLATTSPQLMQRLTPVINRPPDQASTQPE